MHVAFIIPTLVAVVLAVGLSGCGGGGTTTFTTTLFDAHVKWINSALDPEHTGSIVEDGMGPIVGADGTVFVPVGNSLCALDGDDGALKWQYSLVKKSIGVPAVAPDGSLYMLTGTDYNCSLVQAVNGNGTEKWIQDFNMSQMGHSLALGSARALGRNSVVLGSDGTVFGCRHSSVSADFGLVFVSASLFSLNGNDGTIKWQHAFGHHVPQSPVVAPDDTIFLTDGVDRVYAVRGADGFFKWNVSISSPPYFSCFTSSSPSLGANGTVLVCSDHGLVALDGQDGSVKWRQRGACFRQNLQYPGPAVAPDGTIFVQARNDSDVIIDHPNSTLLALNGADGSIKWRYEVRRDFLNPDHSFTTAAVSTDGIVYFGYSESLYALDAENGSLRWVSTSRWGIFDEDQGPPVIAPDGTVIVSMFNPQVIGDSVVAFRGAGKAASAPYVSGYTQGWLLV